MKRFESLLLMFGLSVLLASCGDDSATDSSSGGVLMVAQDQVWDRDYSAEWAPAIGSLLPDLSVKDTAGTSRAFAELTGEKGLLIFFVRSTDW